MHDSDSANTLKEKLLSCAAAYLISYILLYQFSAPTLPAFIHMTVLFIAWSLFTYRRQKRNGEYILWLSGIVALLAHIIGTSGCYPVRFGYFWQDSPFVYLVFIPGFAGYFVLSLSGKMCLGKSSHLLPLDLLRCLILFPVRNMLLFPKTVSAALHTLKSHIDAGRRKTILYGLLTCLIAVIFLLIAGKLLGSADEHFSAMLSRCFSGLMPEIDDTVFARLIFSIPIAMLLLGLVEGTKAESRTALDTRQRELSETLQHVRCLPHTVWCAVLGLFAAFYTLFFIVQAKELWETLICKTAPGTFTMAGWAKEGFFEMCGILALNTALLCTCVLTLDCCVRTYRPARTLVCIIILQSILFALLASGKLALYINAFGLTALRMQGAFGILTGLYGCICALVWLFTGKKTARTFILLTGGTLVVTFIL